MRQVFCWSLGNLPLTRPSGGVTAKVYILKRPILLSLSEQTILESVTDKVYMSRTPMLLTRKVTGTEDSGTLWNRCWAALKWFVFRSDRAKVYNW